MSDFDEALSRAAEDGTARGRLPGAADAVRRGRRRTVRARGGIALLGVAAIGSALGVTAALGGNAGAAPVGPGAGVHADDGILPATQWPGADLARWKLSPNCSLADRRLCHPGAATDDKVKSVKTGDFTGQCGSSTSFPVRRFVQWAAQSDARPQLDADEIVVTFPDRDTAAAFLAEARDAGSPKSCAGIPGAETAAPGVSTADGLSWLLTLPSLGHYGHSYLVQVDERVALLRVNESDDTLQDTAGDLTVLQNMTAALSR